MSRLLTRRNGLIALALVLLSIPATVPFWHADFIFTADSPLHLWRVYELDRALRQGILYPRWAPDLYFGFGYPVFNFYPPFAYYLVETLHVLGLDLPTAFKAIFSLCVFLAAAGAFLLARDIYSDGLDKETSDTVLDAAALVSAAAFAYAPYLLIDIYIRGAIAETLALALLPLFLWSLRRVLVTPRAGRIALAAVVGAVFLLSHNLTAFFSAPILAIYVLLFVFQKPVWRERWLYLGASVVVAAGSIALSAFYWLPGLVEVSMVYIGQPGLTRQALFRTVSEHIQPLVAVVQAAIVYEYPEGPFPLGLTAILLATGGAIFGFLWLNRRVKTELAFFWTVSILAALAITELSRPLWLALPQLWIIQFTWRLTVFVVPGIALAIGLVVIGGYRLSQKQSVALATAIVLGIVLVLTATLDLAAKPWTTVMPPHNLPSILARYEVDSQQVGMSSMHEYLPIWARTVPLPDARTRGSEIPSQPSSADIELVSAESDRWQFMTRAPTPFMLSLRQFYYPDWHAFLDGQSLPVQPGTNVGVVSVQIPAGEHRIQIERRSLPIRDLAWAITTLGIVALGAWWIFAARHGDLSWRWSALAFGITALVFLIPHIHTLSPTRFRLTPTQIDVDSSLRLTGYSTDMSIPSQLGVRFFWQVRSPVNAEQVTSLRLVDAQGKPWATRRQLPRYGTASPQLWFPDQIIEDWYELFLPPDLLAGAYTLQVARGEQPWRDVGTLQLNPAPAPAEAQAIARPLDAVIGSNIRLLGFNAPPLTDLVPGTQLPVTLFWQSMGDIAEDYTVFVHLLDRDTKLAAQQDSLPNNGFTPAILWRPGDAIADPHTLILPPDLRPGEYQLVTGLYRFFGGSRLPVSINGTPYEEDFVPLGTVKVSADRPFQPQHTLALDVGDAIQLTGFSWSATTAGDAVVSRTEGGAQPVLVTRPDSQLKLELAWRAQAKPPRPFTAFVHILDGAGRVVVQKDNPPVDSYYPTDIWEPGERVIDAYTLPLNELAPGVYRVVVGMYDSETRERLALVGADRTPIPNNAVELGQLRVE